MRDRRKERRDAYDEERNGGRAALRHVYLVRAENGLIKIGSALDVKLRLEELRTMSPVPIEIIGIFKYGGVDLEQLLHRELAVHRSHGEWFRVDVASVESALLRAFEAGRVAGVWTLAPYEGEL